VLVAVPARAELLLPALAAALDGGPAVLPVGPSAERVLAALRPDEALEADVAVVVPTSGSTGEPKGALLSADALRASALATADRLGGHGQWLLAIPPTHIGGLQVLVRSLLAGTTPAILDGPFSVEAFAGVRLTGERRYVSLVPTQLLRLLEAGTDLRAYDAILLGAAAAPPALLERAAAAGARVVTTYGMSETAGGCVYDGVPLDGVRVSLVGGVVRLAGPVLAHGYRLQPDLTAASFGQDGFTTSDLGVLREGQLTVLGRADDVIVTGGEKVAPLAVEAALSTHPSVVEVGVAGVADPEWGQRVVAAVVLRAPLTLEQARDHVAGTLPRVWAPRELQEVAALPLLASGKIDRARLLSDPT